MLQTLLNCLLIAPAHVAPQALSLAIIYTLLREEDSMKSDLEGSELLKLIDQVSKRG